MNARRSAVSVLLSLILLLGTSVPAFAATGTLREKITDPAVLVMQSNLLVLGYFPANTKPTKYFGTVTKAAVVKYQKAFKLKADGVVSPALFKQMADKAKKKTLQLKAAGKSATGASAPNAGSTGSANLAGSPPAKTASNVNANLSVGAVPASGTSEAGIGLVLDLLDVTGAAVALPNGAVESGNGVLGAAGSITPAAILAEGETISRGGDRNFLANWFEEVRLLFITGMDATIYDIGTGRSYTLNYSMTSANHADCEAKTAADTETMLSLWGGTFSSKSRPSIIFVGARAFAGSVAGKPHCGRDALPFLAKLVEGDAYGDYVGRENCDKIKGNNMDGHLDVHFHKSRNHYNNLEDPAHQRNVLSANDWALANMPAGRLPVPVIP